MADSNSSSPASRPAGPLTRPLSRRLTRAFAQHNAEGVVTDVGMVTRTMKRLRIASDAVPEWSDTLGQHVRIEINDPLSLYGILRPAETLRTYTIWERIGTEFEIWAHLYTPEADEPEGIGLRWARAVQPGDPVKFWGPQGDFAPIPDTGVSHHLFVGEETATCAFGPMVEALGSNARVYAVLESESPNDEVPLPISRDTHRIRRVHRHGASAVRSSTLLEAVADCEIPVSPTTYAYVAGEAHTCRQIRDHLVRAKGWPRSSIRVKPFWTPGKRGLHH